MRVVRSFRAAEASLGQSFFVSVEVAHAFAGTNEMTGPAVDHDFRRARARVVVGAHDAAVSACGHYGEEIAGLNSE